MLAAGFERPARPGAPVAVQRLALLVIGSMVPGAYPTRCRGVVHNGIVSMFAISTKKSSSLYEQTKSALAQVDANLAEVGTIKGRILHSFSLITDMAQKDEMNRAWDEWADRANPPMRACVACGLTGDSLVEIVLTAAI